MFSLQAQTQSRTPAASRFTASLLRCTGRSGQSVKMQSSFYDLSAKNIDGSDVKFDALKGKVVLITNVASACGYTKSNYTELTELYKKYASQGLEIMAFPCNSFGKQEKGSNEAIKAFAKDQYGAEFMMMDKVEVNGPSTDPVYSYLKGACESCSGDVSWNFAAKFIVDKSCVPTPAPASAPLV